MKKKENKPQPPKRTALISTPFNDYIFHTRLDVDGIMDAVLKHNSRLLPKDIHITFQN